jgi:hypothetical protein
MHAQFHRAKPEMGDPARGQRDDMEEDEKDEQDEVEEEVDEGEAEEDLDGYDSAEDCWRCRDDMCFKHAVRGLGLKLHEVNGSGGSMYTVSFPQPASIPNVPKDELEFNDNGPPNDGIPVKFMLPQDEFILKKFLEYNSNVYPPTRVKQDEKGNKFRVYCYPGRVISLVREWSEEWEQSNDGQ